MRDYGSKQVCNTKRIYNNAKSPETNEDLKQNQSNKTLQISGWEVEESRSTGKHTAQVTAPPFKPTRTYTHTYIRVCTYLPPALVELQSSDAK